jgi:hypothetical protein
MSKIAPALRFADQEEADFHREDQGLEDML